MSNYLHTKIRDIEDHDLREVLAELCHCVRWDPAHHESSTIFHLLSAIFLERADSLTLDHLALPGWLDTKTGKLASVAVLDFCRELLALKHTSLDYFAEKPLLTLIKTCFPAREFVEEEESDFDRETRLVMQRRRNRGS